MSSTVAGLIVIRITRGMSSVIHTVQAKGGNKCEIPSAGVSTSLDMNEPLIRGGGHRQDGVKACAALDQNLG